MTLEGTNTYLYGSDPCVVIDPGSADPGHLEAIRAAAAERGGVGLVLLTHSHADHTEGAEELGVEVVLPEGEELHAGLRALATPGHAADHVCFLSEQRGAKPLHHPTPDLLVDQLRIDNRAAVLDHPVLQQFDEAGVGIDLQPRGLYTVSKGEGILSRDKMPCRHQFGPNAGRQRIGAKINDPGQLTQFNARRAIADVHDIIVDDVEFAG